MTGRQARKDRRQKKKDVEGAIAKLGEKLGVRSKFKKKKRRDEEDREGLFK